MRTPASNTKRNAPHARIGLIVLITALTTSLLLSLAYFAWQRFKPPAVEPPQPTLANTGASHDEQEEIRKNMRKLQQKPGMARVIAESEEVGKKISLTIDGMLDDVTMLQILDILNRYEVTATFFVSGAQASSEPEVVKALADAQQPVGNYTLRAREHLETLTQPELVEDFSVANVIFLDLLGVKPSLLKANVTEYTPSLLEAAQACDLSGAVKSTDYLTYHSFRSYEEVQAYVDQLPYRSIVSVKLSGVLDSSEYTPKVVIERPAIDLQPGTEAQKQAEPILTKEERLLRLIEWLAQAVKNASFSPETVELRQLNGGKLAEPKRGLYTTEAAVGYAFCGLGRMDELTGVLDNLKAMEGVGTFFVTAQEIKDYPEQIEMLISSGQAIGVAVYPKQGDDFYTVCHQLFHTRELLQQYGYEGVRLAMQPWGEIGDALKEAASAMDFMLVSYDIGFARTGNQNAQSAQVVDRDIYGQNTYGLRRGMVALFRMNYFNRSGLVGELLASLAKTRNIYPVKDIYELWNNTNLVYTYPLPEEFILPEVRGKIHAGQLDEDVMERARTRYIGNKAIAARGQLPDFSSTEIRGLDKAGKIPDCDDTAFLTFDDWGSDVNITKLLDVLRKHNVKATFFVRTQFVPDNPNLLRAIALEGHEIASHTHTHMPLAHDPEGKWRFTPITEEEALSLQRDMETSYRVLESIVGDVLLENGKPALSRLFRPPTMAVSRMGMWAAFDCGFSYIVNGAYTSQDYNAKSANKQAQDLLENVRAGGITILHMSDTSIYTADALDRFLTYQAGLGEEKALKFARLSDYLEE